MVDVLNSAMTGMPIITTIHSFDNRSMPCRMARLVQRSEQKMDYDDALKDIYYHFHFYIYLSKKIVNGEVKRFVSEVGYYDDDGVYSCVFQRINGIVHYNYLPISALRFLESFSEYHLFKKVFIKEEVVNEQ